MKHHRLAFEGYKVGELVHNGKKSVVYRAQRLRDGAAVILKALHGDPPAPADVTSLRRQHEIAEDLPVAGVVAIEGYEELDGRHVLLMRDTRGISLARWMDGKPPALEVFLDIAVSLAETLMEIHSGGILHRDINPSNIIIDPSSHEVKLSDFGLALRLPAEAVSPKLVGTLLYIAPEQTGRLNRRVDQRSDLYSLGATFYELLSGSPPFNAADPMELVHKHITRAPASPHLSNSNVPPMISALVLRLLAKRAGERYQTARGLAADLRALRERITKGHALDDFVLGLDDLSSELRIPQRLYGRDYERQTLADALKRARRGACELLLVVGAAGVGKSALVREVFQPMAHGEGNYVSGKFEQYQGSTPYAPLIEVLRQLVERTLALPEAELGHWRERLGQALGASGRLLCDTLPQLELIVGKQPFPTELPPAEARNRFHLMLLRFVGAFTGADRPLVLFLDDLQWADTGSLEVVELLLSAPEISHLLLIGASRVPIPPHIGTKLYEKAAAAKRKHQRIELAPLQQDEVRSLVADTLRCAPEHSRDLADLVRRKTAGNAFFVTQFLTSLHQEGQLSLDEPSGRWQWDVDQISHMAITDNVVELMTRKINRLPRLQRTLLTTAACVGATFDLATLSLLCERSPRRTRDLLRPALEHGLLLPLGELPPTPTAAPEVSFRFLHDRVHQAAYSLLSSEQRQKHHLKLGRLLLARDETRVFEIVHQLNEAVELITNAEERSQLARINLEAGNRARTSSAHRDALYYLETGIPLLTPARWTNQHELAFALHLACAECAFFAGERARSDELFVLLHTHARTQAQKAKIYTCQLMLHDAAGEYQTNRRIGLEALALMGCTAFEDLSQGAVAAGLERFLLRLGEQPIDALIDLPQMTDPEQQAKVSLLVNMTAPAFISDQRLFALIVLEMVNISLEHGVCEMSAFGFGGLGILFNALLDRPEQALAFGELSLGLQQRFAYLPLQCKVEFLMGCFILPWSRPLEQSLAMLRRAHLSGVEQGDLIYAGYAVAIRLRYLYTAGRPLHEVDSESKAFEHFLVRIPGDYLKLANVMTSHARLAWIGKTDEPTRLSSEAFNEEAHVKLMEREGLGLDLFIYWSYRIQLVLAQGHFREAYELALEHGDQVIHQAGMFDQLPYWVSRGIAATGLASEAQAEERELLCADLAAITRRLERWCASSPDNFKGYLLLLEAQKECLRGESWRAARLLGEVVGWARDHGSLLLEATADELAGRLFLEKGLRIPA
ncbi:MAG: serine/threonine-protein kinase PknK, partial [Deltaproteobacteria bacterium]|nr:serine/threonine-protein kinase PknK [Deltaproteobacteria bacterium]